jgi:hypothetical protein
LHNTLCTEHLVPCWWCWAWTLQMCGGYSQLCAIPHIHIRYTEFPSHHRISKWLAIEWIHWQLA